jgi:cytochrome b pre-mRNA-processing protein 3
VGFWQRWFGQDDRRRLKPLYRAIITEARDPAWYRDGAVPDTLDGRFDMVALVMALVLDRLHMVGDSGRVDSVALTEVFIDDMDGQLREIGIGDLVVGKQVGKMMGMLGGRIGAYRDALAAGDEPALEEALVRNLYRGARPADAALAFAAARMRTLATGVAAAPRDRLLAGSLRA